MTETTHIEYDAKLQDFQMNLKEFQEKCNTMFHANFIPMIKDVEVLAQHNIYCNFNFWYWIVAFTKCAVKNL